MLLSGFFFLLAAFVAAVRSSLDVESLQGLYDLVERRLPENAKSFEFVLEPSNNTVGSFVVEDLPRSWNTYGFRGPFVRIKGTSKSACARGLYTYLTTVGEVDISWTSSSLDSLPYPPPAVGSLSPLTGKAIVEHIYFFNTVTFSYTCAFWGFAEWEYLLDWMSLHGINEALAWVGYEKVLFNVFLELGLPSSVIFSWLPMPAFQAWASAFGNLDGNWRGPPPEQWLEDQSYLQKLILERMFDLGINAITPAYTGFAPAEIATLFPNASIQVGATLTPSAPASENLTFVFPGDNLFQRIQEMFLKEYISTYGEYANTSHLYTIDQFNERTLPNTSAQYVSSVMAGNLRSIQAVDPNAKLYIQDWAFFSDSEQWTNETVCAFLNAASADELVILDIFSEGAKIYSEFPNFCGHNWVFTFTLDFGQNQGIDGNLLAMTTGPLDALHAEGSTMSGIGLTMEGMEKGTNYIKYSLALDQAWSGAPIELNTYVSSFIKRRYNVEPLPSEALQAWEILTQMAYNNTMQDEQTVVKSIYELTPAIGNLNKTGYHATIIPYYTPTAIFPPLMLLLEAKQKQPLLLLSDEFHTDVVDIARQLLVYEFQESYVNLTTTFNSSTGLVSTLQSNGNRMLQLLEDIDRILSTDRNFLLSTLLLDAVSWASPQGVACNLANTNVVPCIMDYSTINQTYANFMAWNKKDQIGLWANVSVDYSSRQVGGMVNSLYSPRWRAFIDYLSALKSNGTVADYNAEYVYQLGLSIAESWENTAWDGLNISYGPTGNLWEILDQVLPEYYAIPT